MQPACQSLNYNLADKTCEFNNDTKYFRPKYFVEKPTFVYGENPDSGKFESFFLHMESKKLRYLLYHSVVAARECKHCKILLDCFYGSHCENESFNKREKRYFCFHFIEPKQDGTF